MNTAEITPAMRKYMQAHEAVQNCGLSEKRPLLIERAKIAGRMRPEEYIRCLDLRKGGK